MSAAELAEQMLQVVRREFFSGTPEKQFFQERNLLLQAVTYPADWLHRLGAELPAAEYRRILQTVIDTIREHGNRAKITRFSAYFLHAVQTHMQHHGEEYYIASKQLRPASTAVPGIVRELRVDDRTADVIATLVEVRRALRSKGGRKKKSSMNGHTGGDDLFSIASARNGTRVRPQQASS